MVLFLNVHLYQQITMWQRSILHVLLPVANIQMQSGTISNQAAVESCQRETELMPAILIRENPDWQIAIKIV